MTATRRATAHRFHAPASAESLECRRLLAARLIEDINPNPWSPYGPPDVPGQPLSIGPVALFAHANSTTNVELWRTDGTAAGTYQLKDLYSGPQPSFPSGFVRAGDLAYFKANAGPPPGGTNDQNYQLWRSDGTAAGTFPVSGLNTPGASADRLTPVGSRLFYTGATSNFGTEWWVTDGTSGGARLVRDLAMGAASSNVLVSGTQGTRLLFQTREQPMLLYASDGTEAGTASVGNVGTIQWGFVQSGSDAYFVDQQTRSLWRVGAVGGPVKVLDRAFTGWTVQAAAAAGGAVYFLARNAANTAGAVFRFQPDHVFGPVTLDAGQPMPSAAGIAAMGDTLYVRAASPVSQSGLYRVIAGGSTASPVAGLPAGGSPTDFTLVGDAVFLRAAQTGIYKIASPDAPATFLKNFPLGPSNTDVNWPHGLTAHGGKLLFMAYDPAAGWEPHQSDGTPEGTGLLADASPVTEYSHPGDQVPFNGKVLFTADDGTHGREPWVTDGTAEGTFMLADVNPGAGTSNTWPFTPVGLRAFFPAATGADGVELWVTDGTAAGTRRVRTMRPRPGLTNFNLLTNLVAAGTPGQEYLMFVADDGANGQALWRSDGTEAGTVMVADIHPSTSPDEFAVWGVTPVGDGTVVFAGDDGMSGDELWRSDGTREGTRLLKNIVPDGGLNPGDSWPAHFDRAGGYVYFTAYDPATNRELWRTDGTPEGTVMVADIVPGPLSSSPAYFGNYDPSFIEYRGHVYFHATGPEGSGYELWRTDGTAAGTVLVKDVPSGPLGSMPSSFRVAGGRLYFKTASTDGFAPTFDEIWSTDGTADGTVRLLPPGTMREVGSLATIGDRLYFVGKPAGSSYAEVYTTDGTAAGTFPVADLGGEFGVGDVFTRPVGLADGSLVVFGTDGIHGSEVFRYDNPWTPRVVGRHVFYNRSAFDGNDAAADARDDAAIATDKSAYRRLSHWEGHPSALFTNVTSYSRGINGVMVDMAGLPPGVTLTADDFDFWGANPPAHISIRRGAGTDGSDRVTLVWDDYDFTTTNPSPRMAVANGWLHVTVKANERTGLAAPDQFSFGNLIGESGNSNTSSHVNALDIAAVKRAFGPANGVTSRVDFNRDGLVNALDLATVKRNLTVSIPMPLATGAPLELTPIVSLLESEANRGESDVLA